MTQILYNLRTSDLGYRITKFTDGGVESSYLTSDQACECPAGHRATCRHRQMLPQMLAHNLADSCFFWNHDMQMAVDFDGHQVSLYETLACAPAEQDILDIPVDENGLEQELEDEDEDAETTFEDTEPSVPAGQHTAAESLPPEQTVREDILADLPPNHSARSGDVIGRMSFAEPKPWRRL